MRALLLAALCAVIGFNTYAANAAASRGDNAGDVRGDKELTAKEIEARLKAVKITMKWEDKPLADIVKDLADKTGVKITLSPKSTTEKITLAIANQDGVQALQTIKLMAGVNVTYKNGEVVIE